MKTGIVNAIIYLLAMAGLTQANEPSKNPEELDMAQSTTQFACDLYQKLAPAEGNLFLSPYSVHAALTMTGAGAREQTATQISRVLRLPNLDAPVHKSYGELQAKLSVPDTPDKPAPYRLSVANGLFVQRDFPFLPGYIKLVRSHYRAGTFNVNFATQTEATRLQINNWVAKQTNDKIPDLFAQGILNDRTCMVLVNAIYFKGKWLTAFAPQATTTEPFHRQPGKSVDVPMMHLTDRFPYREQDGVQVLELPYQGRNVSMFILLPQERNQLAKLEKQLTADWVSQLTARAPVHEVEVSLPRFKLTETYTLSDTLQSMGMTDAFTPGQANFSGMTNKEGLVLQQVVHKTFVDVTEEGTEAAAATGVAVGVTSVMEPKPPVVFKADHPFLFLIQHKPTGVILFLGRLSNP